MSDYKLIKLPPQRVRDGCPTRAWVRARDRGYKRDWIKAIDQKFSKTPPAEKEWFDRPS